MADGKINFKSKAATSAVPAAKSLTGKKDVARRWGAVALLSVGSMVVLFTVLNDNNTNKNVPVRKAPEVVINTDPTSDRADNREFGKEVGVELDKLKADLAKTKADLEAAKAKQSSVAPAATPLPPAGITAPPVQGAKPASETPSPVPAPPVPPVKALGLGAGAAALPTPVPAQTSGDISVSGTLPGSNVQQLPPLSVPTSAATPKPKPATSAPAAPHQYAAPALSTVSETTSVVGGTKAASVAGMKTIPARTEFKKNDAFGMLPMGSFAPVVLLHGVDAGTSETSRANPQPVLLMITDNAILPGAAKYKLNSCFAMGTAVGELSTERANIRVDKLSCVDKSNNLVLSEKVSAYIVDSDSIISLRGVVSDKQGAKLGKSLLAGFAQGLSGVLGSTQSQVQTTFQNGLTSSSGVSSSAALRSAGLTGLQQATNQLADFYLKEAQAMFPVVTVAAGRTATLVFSDSVVLKWKNTGSMYSEQVTPVVNN